MKNNIKIDTKKLHIVDIRFYDKSQGVEIEKEELVSKAIVFEHNNHYYNIITNEELPFLTRAPYVNSTKNGTDFGTKLFVTNPEILENKGICYVETKNNFIEEVKEQEYIPYQELEDKILYSKIYFKDRIRIIEDRVEEGIKAKKMKKLAHNDWEKNCRFKEKTDELKNEQKLSKK